MSMSITSQYKVSFTSEEVERITNEFIEAFAKCEGGKIHNFMEDQGLAGGDLDLIAHTLAKMWVKNEEAVGNVVSTVFWLTMKKAALCSRTAMIESFGIVK
jgi:hypothetical protein